MKTLALLGSNANAWRKHTWRCLFGGMRVPVVCAEPTRIIFPDAKGDEAELGYFVDFGVLGEGGRGFFMDAVSRSSGPRARAIIAMVESVGYPLRAEGLTVCGIESEEIWREMKRKEWE